MRSLKYLPLLAVSWSFGCQIQPSCRLSEIRNPFANEHAAWIAMARPTPKLLYHVCYRVAAGRDPAYAETSHMLTGGSSPPESVLHAPEARVMSLPTIPNGRSRRIGNENGSGMALRGGDETLRMITKARSDNI